MYSTRKLAEGYPDLDKIAHSTFNRTLAEQPADSDLENRLTYLNRLIDIQMDTPILEIGCGPRPVTLKKLIDQGYNVLGVEPIRSFVESAGEYIGDSERVIQGEAESLPLPDQSFNVVVFEEVLEHVDSPRKSLEEIWRVLNPGGILYLTTTNRHRMKLNGYNGEYNVPFFNWFPRAVKESYVFQHLHYKPSLANGTTRPAVHWFSFADLCALGRDAGFAQFYSLIDLLRADDPAVRKSSLRKFMLRHLQHNAWLRAMALTQFGGSIVMLKRNASIVD